MAYNAFKNGTVWLDTEGKRIHAHGGSVIYIDGIYYWYGENKEKTNGEDSIWHWGVRCYASTDLYNWEDKGLIIEPDLEHTESSLHPSACMDRPHIIYNKRTKKYVCWMKVMKPDGIQASTVMTADSILGPYTMVTEGLRPLDMDAGDFDLVVAEDGKAYYYFERVHSETICADLNSDYTGVTGYYSTHFPRESPPFVREATAHVKRKGKHYLITSGTTGYLPNPTEAAAADTWHGPYRELGNVHPADESHTSYHSQISCIFKVEGKEDLYIAMADRWLPDKMHLEYEDYAGLYEKEFKKEPGDKADWESLVQKDIEYLKQHGRSNEKPVTIDCKDDTSRAEYIWLPLCFEGENVRIDWLAEWNWETFGEGNEAK